MFISHRLAENFDVSLSSNVRPPAWASVTVDGPFAAVGVAAGTRRSWTTPPWTVRRPGTMRGNCLAFDGDVTLDTWDRGMTDVTLQPSSLLQIDSQCIKSTDQHTVTFYAAGTNTANRNGTAWMMLKFHSLIAVSYYKPEDVFWRLSTDVDDLDLWHPESNLVISGGGQVLTP